MDDQTIRKLIMKHLRDNPEAITYPSDIAEAYDLDARLVFEISEKMVEDGQIVKELAFRQRFSILDGDVDG